jgi:hypothetical protein
MNKFKKLGFIRYDGGIHVNDSLQSVVLHNSLPVAHLLVVVCRTFEPVSQFL